MRILGKIDLGPGNRKCKGPEVGGWGAGIFQEQEESLSGQKEVKK